MGLFPLTGRSRPCVQSGPGDEQGWDWTGDWASWKRWLWPGCFLQEVGVGAVGGREEIEREEGGGREEIEREEGGGREEIESGKEIGCRCRERVR